MQVRRAGRAAYILNSRSQPGSYLQDGQKQVMAVVTGASSGIGLELARECAQNGFDLVVAADRDLSEGVEELSGLGISIEAVRVDLATPEGIDKLYRAWPAGRSMHCSPMLATAWAKVPRSVL
jgi:NAD(P)-dependent dehydrogenase (short-subunit alcohol dehydrogenase family)